MLALEKTLDLALSSTRPIAPLEKAKIDSGKSDMLMKQAQDFEAVFVAQMLNYSGLNKALSRDSGFGGDTFSSMLTQQYATKLVEGGGFGLAEPIYQQLLSKEAGNGSDSSA
ncbi:MAG: hypothetical protein DHS20C05_01570 [Hyphococcus sp.]|nr:MAG: hypothetical protein DHS20C05_01570 [Marinicaulis sp.]